MNFVWVEMNDFFTLINWSPVSHPMLTLCKITSTTNKCVCELKMSKSNDVHLVDVAEWWEEDELKTYKKIVTFLDYPTETNFIWLFKNNDQKVGMFIACDSKYTNIVYVHTY